MRLVIEADSHDETNVFFPPIQDRIRGRFDATRRVGRNPDCASLLGQWTQPVPGQRISIDTTTATGSVIEPLRADEENASIVELFKKRSIKVPESKSFSGIHVPSWLHHMKAIVEAGLARVVEGKVPDKIEGEAKKSFITDDTPDPEEQLRATVAENSEVMKECVVAIKQLAEAISNDWGNDK